MDVLTLCTVVQWVHEPLLPCTEDLSGCPCAAHDGRAGLHADDLVHCSYSVITVLCSGIPRLGVDVLPFQTAALPRLRTEDLSGPSNPTDCRETSLHTRTWADVFTLLIGWELGGHPYPADGGILDSRTTVIVH